MLCTCGKRLTYQGIENGCYILVCLHCKADKMYRIPVDDPRKMPFPWEIPRVKVYTCRDCHARIEEDQALRTFKDLGRALCVSCVDHG